MLHRLFSFWNWTLAQNPFVSFIRFAQERFFFPCYRLLAESHLKKINKRNREPEAKELPALQPAAASSAATVTGRAPAGSTVHMCSHQRPQKMQPPLTLWFLQIWIKLSFVQKCRECRRKDVWKKGKKKKKGGQGTIPADVDHFQFQWKRFNNLLKFPVETSTFLGWLLQTDKQRSDPLLWLLPPLAKYAWMLLLRTTASGAESKHALPTTPFPCSFPRG